MLVYNVLTMNTPSNGRPRVGLRQFRHLISEVVNRVHYGGERVVLERHGSDFVAVIPMQDLEILEKLEDAEDLAAARKVLADIKSGRVKVVPWEDVKKRLLKKHRDPRRR